jgi:hypothetical protein
MAKTGFDFFLLKIVKFNQVNDVVLGSGKKMNVELDRDF